MNNIPLLSGPLAIERSFLDQMIARLSSGPGAAISQPARRALAVRSGAAIIPVTGVITPGASGLQSLFGGTSLGYVSAELRNALSDTTVDRIILAIDSPGGQVSGVSALADEIYAARHLKPIVAHVSGMGASAAYWLASAAGTIIIDDTAMLGSIGVVSVQYDDARLLDRVGIQRHEIVSSQSPRKRPDLNTDAGRAQVQNYVDSLAAVFVGKVASYRGVSPKVVTADFGQGDLLVGKHAVTAGLADRIGNFDAALNYQTSTGLASIAQPGNAASTIAMSSEAPIQREWNSSSKLRDEFGGNYASYLGFRQAEIQGRVKIANGRGLTKGEKHV